ncbi:MAG TPA: hypothetical protein PK256_04555 [Verrucomicrobiota bacterium]|nr:hypothetical protein [Verrucomicrobiota bacterium]
MKSTCSLLGFFVTAFLSGSLASTRGDISHYQAAVKNEAGLISYYTFDAEDASDFRSVNPGTIVGTVSFDAGLGHGANKALVLKGTGHVNLGGVDSFDFVGVNGTVEAWIRADWKTSPGYNPAIFSDRDGGPVNWSVHMNADKRTAGLWNGSSYEPLALPATGTNWHHLAVVFDTNPESGTSRFTLYWDGSPVGHTTQALGPSPESPTQLGSASASGLERWIGALDEVAFYSEALSAAAIQAHYTAFLVGDPPSILTQPQGGIFLQGVQLALSVEAKGAGLSYQWYQNNLPVPNATDSALTLNQLGAVHIGAYQVVVANAAGGATSAVAQVELGDLPGKLIQYQAAVRSEPSLISLYSFDHLDAQDSKDNHHGTSQGQVAYADGMGGGAGKALILNSAGHVNLGQVEAFSFASGKGTIESWVRADWTSALGLNPTLFANRDGGSVTWSIHMNDSKDGIGLWNGNNYLPQPTPGTGTAWHHLAVVFDTDNATGDPRFLVYWDGVSAGGAPQGLGMLADLPVQLGSSSASGQERWVGALDEVAFYSDALDAAAIQAHYTAFIAGDPPLITVQPRGGSYFANSSLTLRVGAQGLDLSYQWLKNGLPIEGANTPNLSFGALTASDVASYRVRVSNPAGSVESESAVVTVIVPDLARYQKTIRDEPDLISFYTFDTGDAMDSKSANHGIVVDAVDFQTGVGGGADQALVLDGYGHVDLSQVSVFDFASGKGTVEAWLRADWTSGPGYNPTVFADRDGGPVNWSVHLNAGKEAAGLWNGSTHQPMPVANTGFLWHHLAVVFDVDNESGSSTFTLYWDGLPVGTTLQALGPSPDAPTELGSASVLGQERWIGALDEVAFYSGALSAKAIQNHYQALLGGSLEPPVLSCSRSGSQVVLSWPAETTGFTLESAAVLPADSWAPVPGVVNNSVTLDASSGTRFFCLRSGP